MTEEFLTERLQKAYPVGRHPKERTIEAALQVKKNLRTFYSLDITEKPKKFTLVYNIDSDGKQKREAGKLRKLHLADVEKREEFNRIRKEIKDAGRF